MSCKLLHDTVEHLVTQSKWSMSFVCEPEMSVPFQNVESAPVFSMARSNCCPATTFQSEFTALNKMFLGV